MGCFLGCFGGAKDRRRRRQTLFVRRTSPKRNHTSNRLDVVSFTKFEKDIKSRLSPRKITGEELGIESLIELKGENPEFVKNLLPSIEVVKPDRGEEVVESILVSKSENNELEKPLKSCLSPKKPNREEATVELLPNLERDNFEQGSSGGSLRKKVTFNLNIKTIEDVSVIQELNSSVEDEECTEEESVLELTENETSPRSSPFPSNHRYQNVSASDEEEEEEDENYKDFDSDEDEVIIGEAGNEEESYESYFSLPLDKERESEKESSQEVNSPKPAVEVSDNVKMVVAEGNSTRDRSKYVNSILNPVENLLQWREVKASAVPAKQRQPSKENINMEHIPHHDHQSFTVQKTSKVSDSYVVSRESSKQEVSVDASLSSWLGTPQASESQMSNSSYTLDDKPILGALTVNDLKHSATSSPRKSPSRSPDEVPIVGTVGRYWSCANQECDSGSSRSVSDVKGIPNTTSKYREDRRVNWHSTPFEVRLERALNKGANHNLSGFRV